MSCVVFEHPLHMTGTGARWPSVHTDVHPLHDESSLHGTELHLSSCTCLNDAYDRHSGYCEDGSE